MAKIYDTGNHRWQHGQAVAWDSWNHAASRWLYGPCPLCGSITSSYGGGFSCHNDYCPCSANVFTCSAGPDPDWWNTDIDVKLDGNAWCATGTGFIDLQSSPAGFGKTPQEAVADYRKQISTETMCESCEKPVGDDAPIYEDANICRECHDEITEAEATDQVEG